MINRGISLWHAVHEITTSLNVSFHQLLYLLLIISHTHKDTSGNYALKLYTTSHSCWIEGRLDLCIFLFTVSIAMFYACA
jgi:hypothetical protein